MAKEDYAIRNDSGLDLIIKERERQISVEGWTPEHDAEHIGGEMAVVAACYATEGMKDVALVRFGVPIRDSSRPAIVDAWPRDWEGQWDKRLKHDQIRRLTIAAALIAAEIDRIQAEKVKGN